LTRDIEFNIILSKLTVRIKLNHFYKNKDQIKITKNWRTNLTLINKYKNNLTQSDYVRRILGSPF